MVRKALLFASLFLVTALAGCTFPGDDGDGTGSASIYVKDAPTDEFSEIHVVFTEVRVHRAEAEHSGASTSDSMGDNETMDDSMDGMDDNETDDDGGDWVTVFENETGVDVDLLNTSGARAAFLGEADLTAGRYTQIRITVEEAYGIDADGGRHDFAVSSGTLKVVRSFDVESGQETRIVLDFDLDRSLHETGHGDWRMTPVIGKTHVDEVEDEESGEESSEEGEVEEIEDLEE